MGVPSLGDCNSQGTLRDDSWLCSLLHWWGMLLPFSGWRPGMLFNSYNAQDGSEQAQMSAESLARLPKL